MDEVELIRNQLETSKETFEEYVKRANNKDYPLSTRASFCNKAHDMYRTYIRLGMLLDDILALQDDRKE